MCGRARLCHGHRAGIIGYWFILIFEGLLSIYVPFALMGCVRNGYFSGVLNDKLWARSSSPTCKQGRSCPRYDDEQSNLRRAVRSRGCWLARSPPRPTAESIEKASFQFQELPTDWSQMSRVQNQLEFGVGPIHSPKSMSCIVALWSHEELQTPTVACHQLHSLQLNPKSTVFLKWDISTHESVKEWIPSGP